MKNKKKTEKEKVAELEFHQMFEYACSTTTARGTVVVSGFQQDNFSGSVSYIYSLGLFFYPLCFSSDFFFFQDIIDSYVSFWH